MIRSSPAVRISLVASELPRPVLGDVALFIYDFDSLYEVVRLSVDPRYEDFRFSRFALYRNGRPLKPEDRMHVESIRLESPLELVTTILAVSAAASSVLGTLLLATQVLEKTSNFRLSRRKLSLEVLRLERDLGIAKNETLRTLPQDPIDRLTRRDALPYVFTLTNRLEKSQVVVAEIRFDVIHIPDRRQSDSK